MKILYVDMQYDYGKKSRGLNQIGQIGFLGVFKSLGHEVSEFYYDDYLSNTDHLQETLLNKANDVNPDLIFFCLYTDQFKISTLDRLKIKYKTLNWFGDDQWRFDKFTRNYAPHFTWSVTTDPFSIPRYHKIGIKNVILSQWAALNEPLKVISPRYEYEVSFVGGGADVRKWFLFEFEKAGIKVAAFGNKWPNGPVSLERMQEIFAKSKVNLNLSNSITYDLRFLKHNPKNILHAIRGVKNASQMKARNFEIPYFGGFQITDYVPTIENYFDIGKEIVCFSNVDEAIQLTKHYLENDELRELIKGRGILRTRTEHTYLDRFKEIFNAIK
jgi:spore maturation protein CgeB